MTEKANCQTLVFSDSNDTINLKKRCREDDLSLEEIQALFHLPITIACLTLNIEMDPLIQKCREFGIKRWPYNARKEYNKTLKIEKKKEIHGIFFDFQVDPKTQKVPKKKKNNITLPSFNDFVNGAFSNKNVFE